MALSNSVDTTEETSGMHKSKWMVGRLWGSRWVVISSIWAHLTQNGRQRKSTTKQPSSFTETALVGISRWKHPSCRHSRTICIQRRRRCILYHHRCILYHHRCILYHHRRILYHHRCIPFRHPLLNPLHSMTSSSIYRILLLLSFSVK